MDYILLWYRSTSRDKLRVRRAQGSSGLSILASNGLVDYAVSSSAVNCHCKELLYLWYYNSIFLNLAIHVKPMNAREQSYNLGSRAPRERSTLFTKVD
ncbi:uncharacterized protein LAJ45_00714 [Morchella importuna]|uniref:uncharacterized protein n=1 Tax=Morchella importuna TaxID=1174673 RepID=UPI001E8EF043|nr:uncharacterized protein LAJ45_00714 [Morchella importuna]KAH8155704.1 hypothetical protein LAJ45_00714 [Morchella importuna]